MTDQDFHWLVGILEGEACFHAYRNQRKAYLYPKISVEMTDLDVIQRVQRIIGSGAMVTKEREGARKTIYRYSLSGVAAEKLMREVLPFMGKRRAAKIKEILTQLNNPFINNPRPTQPQKRDKNGKFMAQQRARL